MGKALSKIPDQQSLMKKISNDGRGYSSVKMYFISAGHRLLLCYDINPILTYLWSSNTYFTHVIMDYTSILQSSPGIWIPLDLLLPVLRILVQHSQSTTASTEQTHCASVSYRGFSVSARLPRHKSTETNTGATWMTRQPFSASQTELFFKETPHPQANFGVSLI